MEDIPALLASTRVFEGRVFAVRSDLVGYADGSEHRLDVVEHRGSLAIVALRGDDSLVLVRQYRHPAGRSLWELPAGTVEPGEDPMEGARRELREETGYTAGRMAPAGSLYVTPGFCDEVMHFFIARELEPGEQSLDEDERIDVGCFGVEEAWSLVARGEIADAKTVLALFWMGGARGEIGAPL